MEMEEVFKNKVLQLFLIFGDFIERMFEIT